ncbi:hypothetical protein U1Q18_044239 [Sarracenia purpurea var. burkii]
MERRAAMKALSEQKYQRQTGPNFPALRPKEQRKAFELRDGSCKLSEDAVTRSFWCFALNKRSWIVVTLAVIANTNELGKNVGHLGTYAFMVICLHGQWFLDGVHGDMEVAPEALIFSEASGGLTGHEWIAFRLN